MKCVGCDGTGYKLAGAGVAPCGECEAGRSIIEAREQRRERQRLRMGGRPQVQVEPERHFQDREEEDS